MSNVIQTKRVVVSNGNEFDNPKAFERHEHQAKIGKAFSSIKIKRADAPLVRSDDAA